MRVLILGGTRFIGRRIAADLMARGDDVTVVHRGESEPDELADCTHLHADRAALARHSGQLRALRPDAVIDTRAMTEADAEAVLPHLPDAHLVLLSSIDVYRAYELLLAGQGGEPVPLTEESPVRQGRYPLRGLLPGLGDNYDKLDVEPGYLARGGTALRLAMIYGEHDGQRREEFILRRVRAGRRRIPVGPGTSLDTRCYVGDVAAAVLAALDRPWVAEGQVFYVGAPASTPSDYAGASGGGHGAELVMVPGAQVPDDLRRPRAWPSFLLSTAARGAFWLGPTDPAQTILVSVRWHLAHLARPRPGLLPDDRALAAARQPRRRRLIPVRPDRGRLLGRPGGKATGRGA
jgi:nucleoside-diphosphate-sugar epimerase